MKDNREVKQTEFINEFGELEYMIIPNYRKKKYFLSIPEYKFFLTLKQIYHENKHIEIFTQVALNRIIEFNNERAKEEFAYFKFEERSIDFVIYNTEKGKSGILYCIELNGKEHEENQERIERDRMLKKIFEIAEIELKFIKQDEIKVDIINDTEYFDIDSVKKLLNIE